MDNKFRKDTTINVSKTAKSAIIAHLPKKVKIGPWTEEAIYEKIERETTLGVPTLERQEKILIPEPPRVNTNKDYEK